MNERIQELLVQSGLLINVSEYRVNELDPNIKKFAELIVKECADIGDLYEGGEYQVRTQILAHFGVENA